MNQKLCQLFLEKQRNYLMAFAILLIISGLCVNYQLMTYASFYYKWQSLFWYDESWYWYSDEDEEHNEIENYLLTEQDGISAHEYRCENYRYIDGKDVAWDNVDYGVFFQAEEKDITGLREKFKKYMKIRPVPEIVREEWRTATENGAVSFLLALVIWGITIAGGVFWFRKALEQSGEENDYLFLVGFSPQAVRARYGRCIWFYFVMAFFVSFVPRILAYFPSTLHYVFTDFEFWRIYPSVILGMFLFYFLTFVLLNYLFKKAWKKEYGEGNLVQEKKHIFIGDLTLEDNLALILIAQGYSEKSAESLVGQMVEEEKLSFCAEHQMATCPGETKLIFFRLQDKLLEDSIE